MRINPPTPKRETRIRIADEVLVTDVRVVSPREVVPAYEILKSDSINASDEL